MKKLLSILRWILLGLIVPGILTVLAYFLFPFAYWQRNCLRKCRNSGSGWKRIISLPLWIFLDDAEFRVQGHDYGEPWWRIAKGIKIDTPWQKFKAAYLWCVVRNPAWNMYELLHPKFGKKVLLQAEGSLTQDGHSVSIWNFATLKYVDRYGNYMDNKGPFLSLVYSILGRSFVWYTIGDRLYWRRSFAGYRFGRWWELHAGTTDVRYTLRFKIKKVKTFEETPMGTLETMPPELEFELKLEEKWNI